MTTNAPVRYHGHDRGVVVTQPESGKFVERPMTPGELRARRPAAEIQDRIYEFANYAGVCYINIWEIIAKAIDGAIDATPKAEHDDLERSLAEARIVLADVVAGADISRHPTHCACLWCRATKALGDSNG